MELSTILVVGEESSAMKDIRARYYNYLPPFNQLGYILHTGMPLR